MTKIKIATSLLLLIHLAFLADSIHAQNRITRQQYIDTYKDWAISSMNVTGIPASITLAQGILESASGNSTLAKRDNNHFGIKCHSDWTGKRVYHHDDARNECFRKYNSALESFQDHSEFLTTRSRYAALFELATTDYKGWAHGLRKAGYATNPQYAQLLIRIIEEEELYQYDQNISPRARKSNRELERRKDAGGLVINPYETRPVKYNNGVKYVELQEGDTFESLARMFNLKAWELPHYNDLPPNTRLDKYRLLYVESKRRNAHPDHPHHTVRSGESMHEISQIYGIRLNRLYYLNRMEEGTEPQNGDRLNLRKRVKY
ncbi:glucosaminidase domain-containing protein [Geofilum rubicundum]|nr:glucosaminidase domain-containing protein [Geofilum rubicundum]